MTKSEAQAIRRCLPYRKCGKQPMWGAAFLVCPAGHYESDYDEPHGNAVRDWNRQMKEGGR